MNNNSSFYPDVFRGTEIEWAPSPLAGNAQWILGRVAITKNDSCDIELAGGGVRMNCLHVDDPRCRETKEWAETNRGVFRLSRGELERRAATADLQTLKTKMLRLEQMVEEMVLERKTDVQDAPPTVKQHRPGRKPAEVGA